MQVGEFLPVEAAHSDKGICDCQKGGQGIANRK